jgi:ribonuclease E
VDDQNTSKPATPVLDPVTPTETTASLPKSETSEPAQKELKKTPDSKSAVVTKKPRKSSKKLDAETDKSPVKKSPKKVAKASPKKTAVKPSESEVSPKRASNDPRKKPKPVKKIPIETATIEPPVLAKQVKVKTETAVTETKTVTRSANDPRLAREKDGAAE